MSFYTEVLGMDVTDRESTAALLGSGGYSPLILRAMGKGDMRAPGSVGIQYVMWAASSKEDLDRAERVLKQRSAHVETRPGDGCTVVEGRDPDGIPVMIAYPGVDLTRMRELPARIYAW